MTFKGDLSLSLSLSLSPFSAILCVCELTSEVIPPSISFQRRHLFFHGLLLGFSLLLVVFATDFPL
jgi:hypothetical protein